MKPSGTILLASATVVFHFRPVIAEFFWLKAVTHPTLNDIDKNQFLNARTVGDPLSLSSWKDCLDWNYQTQKPGIPVRNAKESWCSWTASRYTQLAGRNAVRDNVWILNAATSNHKAIDPKDKGPAAPRVEFSLPTDVEEWGMVGDNAWRFLTMGSSRNEISMAKGGKVVPFKVYRLTTSDTPDPQKRYVNGEDYLMRPLTLSRSQIDDMDNTPLLVKPIQYGLQKYIGTVEVQEVPADGEHKIESGDFVVIQYLGETNHLEACFQEHPTLERPGGDIVPSFVEVYDTPPPANRPGVRGCAEIILRVVGEEQLRLDPQSLATTDPDEVLLIQSFRQGNLQSQGSLGKPIEIPNPTNPIQEPTKKKNAHRRRGSRPGGPASSIVIESDDDEEERPASMPLPNTKPLSMNQIPSGAQTMTQIELETPDFGNLYQELQQTNQLNPLQGQTGQQNMPPISQENRFDFSNPGYIPPEIFEGANLDPEQMRVVWGINAPSTGNQNIDQRLPLNTYEAANMAFLAPGQFVPMSDQMIPQQTYQYQVPTQQFYVPVMQDPNALQQGGTTFMLFGPSPQFVPNPQQLQNQFMPDPQNPSLLIPYQPNQFNPNINSQPPIQIQQQNQNQGRFEIEEPSQNVISNPPMSQSQNQMIQGQVERREQTQSGKNSAVQQNQNQGRIQIEEEKQADPQAPTRNQNQVPNSRQIEIEERKELRAPAGNQNQPRNRNLNQRNQGEDRNRDRNQAQKQRAPQNRANVQTQTQLTVQNQVQNQAPTGGPSPNQSPPNQREVRQVFANLAREGVPEGGSNYEAQTNPNNNVNFQQQGLDQGQRQQNMMVPPPGQGLQQNAQQLSQSMAQRFPYMNSVFGNPWFYTTDAERAGFSVANNPDGRRTYPQNLEGQARLLQQVETNNEIPRSPIESLMGSPNRNQDEEPTLLLQREQQQQPQGANNQFQMELENNSENSPEPERIVGSREQRNQRDYQAIRREGRYFTNFGNFVEGLEDVTPETSEESIVSEEPTEEELEEEDDEDSSS